MSGRKLLLIFLALSFFSACSAPKTDELQDQELAQMIDRKEYMSVLQWFNLNSPAETKEEFKIYRAYALLGLGGLEPIKFAMNVRGIQSIQDPILARFFSHCANKSLGPDEFKSDKCLVVRIMNQLPNPDSSELRQAQTLMRDMHKRGQLTQQDTLLLSFLETCFVLARVKSSLLMYARLDEENINYDQAVVLFDQLHLAAQDMKLWVGNLKQDQKLLTQKLTGFKDFTMFQTGTESPIEFAEGTGLPKLLRVTSMQDESALAVIGRNAIIQALDQAVYFFEK